MTNYTVDKSKDTPLYIQIRDNIIHAIEKRQLKPGDKLPPVASLAKEIGVTQATIRRAIEDLKKIGHTKCYVGRGTFIKDASLQETTPKNQPEPTALRELDKPFEFAAKKMRCSISKALADIMSLTEKPGIIKLTSGVPDHTLLPEQLLQKSFIEATQNDKPGCLECMDSQGSYELRREIARHFFSENSRITAENVLITNGSIQAASLIAQSAIGKDYSVIFETPCYTGMANSFAAMGHWVNTIVRDDSGPCQEALKRLSVQKRYLLYLCPYAHNPMGTDLTRERLDLLVNWARKTGSTLISDELFKDLRYTEKPPVSIIEALGEEQSVIISSLSKAIAPGLRVGWLISSKEKVRELTQLKRVMDHSTPPLMQGIALSLLTSGQYDNHTKEMRKIYQQRISYTQTLLENLMPDGVSWTKPDGGYSILLTLPQGYSSISLFLLAIEKGVAFLPGPLFDLDQRFVNTFRISCAWANEAYLKEGIELLADAVSEYLRKPSGDLGLSGIGNFL